MTVLLDCGDGMFSKLRRHVDYVNVDAVVISRMHADHFLDLVPFSYALSYARASGRSQVGGSAEADQPRRGLACACRPEAARCCGASSLLGRRPGRQRLPRARYDAGDTVCGRPLTVGFVPHFIAAFRPMSHPDGGYSVTSAPTAGPTRSSCASPARPMC